MSWSETHDRAQRLAWPAWAALLFAMGLGEAVFVYWWAPRWEGKAALHVGYTAATCIAVFVLGRVRRRPLACPGWAALAVLAGAFAVTIVLAQVAMHAYPNSGDEYGYSYVADTLLHGRLWNRPLPEGLRDVFQTFYIVDRDGKRASQYAPGWPAVLAGFTLLRVPQFGNAVLGLLAGTLLWLGLRRVPAPFNVRVAALALGMTAPFMLFNDASFFSHTLTGAALLGIIWLGLRDADAPSPWNRVGIGFGFSVLLTTRYETFLIGFALFALDNLWRRRARAIAWSLPAAAGGVPLLALFLFYNWRVTGSPFQTTLAWASPGIGYGPYATGIDGPHSPLRGLINTGRWLEGWQDFASVILLPLYAVAMWRLVATRRVRWFDLILPATVGFFFFYPDDGGFQYGPRYWYFGYVPLPLTLAAGLQLSGGAWRIGRWCLDPLRLAAAQLPSFAGFTVGYAMFLSMQAEVRLLPARAAADAAARGTAPSVVLVGDELARYISWERSAHWMLSLDYTRNGVDGFGRVVTGRYLGEARTALLCRQMPDRRIYRASISFDPARVELVPVCNGAE